jgi:Predicted membrane protein (DUF2178)
VTTGIARSPVLVTGVVIGAGLGVAQLFGGGSPAQALLAFAITAGYALVVTVLARRSETAGALAGRPVDERWEHINLEASAWALGVSAIVVIAAFAVAEATGGDWQPYALVAVTMAVAYFGSLVIVRVRH